MKRIAAVLTFYFIAFQGTGTDKIGYPVHFNTEKACNDAKAIFAGQGIRVGPSQAGCIKDE